MTRVEQIEEQVKSLAPADLRSFRAWFLEFDAEVWDRELQRDVEGGRLEALAKEAVADHATGRTRRL